MKVALITNIPSPYRVLQFDRLSSILNDDLYVLYYQHIEQNRNWLIPKLKHKNFFFKKTFLSKYNIHPEIFYFLKSEKPDIIIAAGFTPTIIFSFLYSKLKKKKFVVFTDSWLYSVNKMSLIHRLIRKLLIPLADSSICVGLKGEEFLKTYNAKPQSIFISPLAIDNLYFSNFTKLYKDREFDVMFSGQFIQRKLPFFVIEIMRILKTKIPNVKFLLIGSGPLESEILKQLDQYQINYSYPGFIQQEDLPKHYANSKILLFPSEDDPWGLVANEANAVGTPVITCENTGVANDLVINNYNGYVLPLIADIWVNYILTLLLDSKLYETFSKNSLEYVQHYSIDNAANGINKAINYCLRYEKG